MAELTIEVEAFWGDNDTWRELHLVGPFDTEPERAAALEKLRALPGNSGSALFGYSSKPMAAADEHVTPQRLAEVTDFEGLLDAFEYGPPNGH